MKGKEAGVGRQKLSYDIISIQLTLQWFLITCFRITWSWDERYGCLYSKTEKSFDMNSEGLVTLGEAILCSGGSAPRSLGAMGFLSRETMIQEDGEIQCNTPSTTGEMMIVFSKSCCDH